MDERQARPRAPPHVKELAEPVKNKKHYHGSTLLELVTLKLIRNKQFAKAYQFASSLRVIKSLIFFAKEIDNKRARKSKMQFYKQFIKKNDLCFDIGANIGSRTEILLGLGCWVIAVEPQNKCTSYLKKKFGSHNNLIIVEKAIGEKIGKTDMFISDLDAVSSMSKEWIETVQRTGRLQHVEWNKRVAIDTTTLDQLIMQYGVPVFCKIDVEGYEFNVLKGLSRPIPLISFEFTPGYDEASVNCVRHLQKLGTFQFNYSLVESMQLALPAWVNASQIISILRSFDESNPAGDIYARSIPVHPD